VHCIGWESVKNIWPIEKLSDEILAWLSVCICIWYSWCHCHPITSCFIKIQKFNLPF